MRVLVAFDKFKDALTARDACLVAARALHVARPDWIVDLAPLADGGDGFRDILMECCGGSRLEAVAPGPLGTGVQTSIGLVDTQCLPAAARGMLRHSSGGEGRVGIIEMASVCGLAMLPQEQRDPMRTSTRGCGRLIARLCEAPRATGILLGIGGSATNDLGLGCLAELGLRFLNASGNVIVDPVPGVWRSIVEVEGELPATLPPIDIACDVRNPLLGADGAAATYGPQKGLKARDLAELEQESARMAELLCRHFGRSTSEAVSMPGAGAAGGIGFGLAVAANARFVPGADLVSAWLDLDRRIAAADLLITGEGRFDCTSLDGKGPSSVLRQALTLGKPAQVYAGAIEWEVQRKLALLFPTGSVRLKAITPEGMPLIDALRRAGELLGKAVAECV